jgi:hypothetical protein
MILDTGRLVIMHGGVPMLWSWMLTIGFYGIRGKDFPTLRWRK